ncbi:DUF4360 domain-containing protein [Actinomadura sp. KC06]|uniref:DUF4360 domain-containing protein n=1 Tax=Actinomadura sp. KC06 TaxID=2530369 RepID=UPI00104A8EC9|nr:DUF4360 domain-containing protein [Actinomadura sp. KC06]TDD23031.1 DUF4360 domain-containing protein [Actinomadura sp. KC06]
MKNATRTAIAVGAALLLPTLATATAASASIDPPAADAPPVPSKVTIGVETINGSGCPAGTTKVTPSHGNTAFTVTYDKYVAWAGGGAPSTDFRKNCQLSVQVDAPEGYTYAVVGIESRGYAHLEAGATAVRRTNYYFQGNSESQTVTHTLKGPFDDDWRFADKTDTQGRIFKPCGKDRNLNINTELRVDAGDSAKSSFIAMESARGNSVYHLVWKRCD